MRRSPAFRLAPVLLLFSCGPEPTTWVEGTMRGREIGEIGQAFQIPFTDDYGGQGLCFFLSDYARTCEELQERDSLSAFYTSTEDPEEVVSTVVLSPAEVKVGNDGVAIQGGILQPGEYPIVDTGEGMEDGTLVAGGWVEQRGYCSGALIDPSCVNEIEPAVSGTLWLTTVGSTVSTGHFELETSFGDRLQGAFEVTTCEHQDLPCSFF